MSLISFRPKNQETVPSIFNEDLFFAPFFHSSALKGISDQFYPALDVSEDASYYKVEADLPGLRKEDVQVSFNEGVLTIEGERKSETEKRDKNYHRVERSYGKFVRSVNLGTAVDAQGIKADYKNGVLHVQVPKSEKAKPKTIEINVN